VDDVPHKKNWVMVVDHPRGPNEESPASVKVPRAESLGNPTGKQAAPGNTASKPSPASAQKRPRTKLSSSGSAQSPPLKRTIYNINEDEAEVTNDHSSFISMTALLLDSHDEEYSDLAVSFYSNQLHSGYSSTRKRLNHTIQCPDTDDDTKYLGDVAPHLFDPSGNWTTFVHRSIHPQRSFLRRRMKI